MPTETTSKGGNGKPSREAAEAALESVPEPTAAYTLGTSPVETVRDIKSRTMYVPRMPYGGTRMLAAAFKSIGLDARPVPDEDPGAGARAEDTFALEVPVDLRDRVRVDDEVTREGANGGELLAGGEAPGRDREADLFGDLLADRHRARGFDSHDHGAVLSS